MITSILLGVFVVFVVSMILKTITIVPQQSVYIVERLGKFDRQLDAGLHFLIPIIDRISAKLSLQEIPMDTAAQTVITKDNVSVVLDGILYYQITDAKLATYGVNDFEFAIESLAKTTLRAESGKYELDRMLEARETINTAVVTVLDEAARTWGLKVLRFEVKDITPPSDILEAMQRQMIAERNRRALVADSEGQKTAAINKAEGEKAAHIARSEAARQELINVAEGNKASQIAEAQGRSEAIKMIADATAASLERIGQACSTEGGKQAVQLEIAQKAVEAFATVAKDANSTLIVPSDMSAITSLVKGVQAVLPKDSSK